MIRIDLFGRRHVAPEFWKLPASGRLAVIAHEAGHRYYGHLWRRWLARWAYDAVTRRKLYHAQEFQADQFAREMGYAAPLVAVLALQPHGATVSHPSTRDRIAWLAGG